MPSSTEPDETSETTVSETSPTTDQPEETAATENSSDEASDASADGEVDEEALRDELFSKVEEAVGGYLTCVQDPEGCDFETTVGAHVSGPYRTDTLAQVDSLIESGLRARVPETDDVYYVGHLAQDVTPFQAIVRVCIVDTGVLYRPGVDGGAEEIIDSEALAATQDFLVLEDADGVLRVDDYDVIQKTSGDTSLCDEYL